MLKHCLSLKTFMSSFVAFFVSLGILMSCIRKCCSQSLQLNGSLRQPAIVSLSTDLPVGGQCPLVRDSEPIRLLEIPTSPSLYMLIYYIL